MVESHWLQFNRPTSTALIHVEGGCHWVIEGAERFRKGLPYGRKRGDNKNGFWKPFNSLAEAEAAQKATGARIQDHCAICWGQRSR
jgi:hypothetical protein